MGQGQFRGIVTIITFLSIILIVMGVAATTSPTFLATTTPDAPDASDKTDPMKYLAWNVSEAFNLNSTQDYLEYEIPQWHMTTWVERQYAAGLCIHVFTWDYWWVFHTNEEPLGWFNESTGTKYSLGGALELMPVSTIEDAYALDVLMLDENASLVYGGNLNYRLTNTRGSLHITLGWNTTSYGGNLTAAYYGDGIWFSLKQDFSDRQTTINLMDVLTGLFLGSLFGSNTLGIDPTISAIITIALDASMAYLVFSIVRSMIPFINGSD